MNDDSSLAKRAVSLLESGDFSISSWQSIIETVSSESLLNLLTAARAAMEYGTKNKVLKGLPKKSWDHAVANAKKNPDKDSEGFIEKVETLIKQNKIKIA